MSYLSPSRTHTSNVWATNFSLTWLLFKHLMHPKSVHLFHTWVVKPINCGACRSKLSNPISYITYSPVARLLGGHSPNASCKNEQNHTDIWSFSITKYWSTLTLMKKSVRKYYLHRLSLRKKIYVFVEKLRTQVLGLV